MPIKPGWVAIWLGSVESPEALKRYVRVDYDEAGDSIPSDLQRDFLIEDFEIECLEWAYFDCPVSSVGDALRERGFSYADIVTQRITAAIGGGLVIPVSAIVALYEFAYSGAVKAAHHSDVQVRFAGNLRYADGDCSEQDRPSVP